MTFNKKFRRENLRASKIICSCGSEAKLSSRKNYPHGRKSGGVTSWFYKCKSCKKQTYFNKEEGGKK